jgi:hypothetical protein
VKALSLRQPWAHAVLHLGKGIENRRWNTSYRGPILIHASAGIAPRSDFDGSCLSIRDVLMSGFEVEAWERFQVNALRVTSNAGRYCYQPRDIILRGGIIGRARLVDVIPPCRPAKQTTANAWRDLFANPCEHRWHAPEQFGFILTDVEPLPFRPYKGALGLFEIPDLA